MVPSFKFIEDNWKLGTIGDGSYDAKAGSLSGMFDFSGKSGAGKLTLDPSTGEPAGALVSASQPSSSSAASLPSASLVPMATGNADTGYGPPANTPAY